MTENEVDEKLKREYPSNNTFKNFFQWFKMASKGHLDKENGFPTQETCINTFHTIIGQIKRTTGKEMPRTDTSDIYNFIKSKLDVPNIKKPKYVADIWVLQQMIQHWWSHNYNQEFRPTVFPLFVLLQAYLVARPGALIPSFCYERIGIQYKVRRNNFVDWFNTQAYTLLGCNFETSLCWTRSTSKAFPADRATSQEK
jgi:hypothetical protein